MAYGEWKVMDPNGRILAKTFSFAADGSQALPMEEITGGILHSFKYKTSTDAAVDLTLVDSTSINYLGTSGTITDGTTGGHKNLSERVVDTALTLTLANMSGGTASVTLYVRMPD